MNGSFVLIVGSTYEVVIVKNGRKSLGFFANYIEAEQLARENARGYGLPFFAQVAM